MPYITDRYGLSNGRNKRARHAQVNKNLYNYPLARDPHTRQHWRRSGDLWLCNLPGDDRIEFSLESDADESLRRVPTAFDMNVLFLLLGEAQDRESDTIAFSSSAVMLKALNATVDCRNRRRLKSSLQYLHSVSIRYECWHEVGKDKRITKTLPPLIETLHPNGRQATLRKEWLDINKLYFQKVCLPLPANAAGQNLVLALIVSRDSHAVVDVGTMGAFKFTRKVRTICRKIGLNHSARNRELTNIIDRHARSYFKGQRLELAPIWDEPNITFYFAATKLSVDDDARAAPIARKQPKQRAQGSIIRKRPKQKVQEEREAQPKRPVKVRAFTEQGRSYQAWQLPNGDVVDELPREWRGS
jgi:hypothetical protein